MPVQIWTARPANFGNSCAVIKGEGKGKVQPRTGHEDPKGE
jgi:hypothetical protein